MRLYYYKKFTMLYLFLILIIIVFLFITVKEFVSDGLITNKSQNSDSSTLIKALNSYYGEWEIVEDYGYHGVHKMTEIEVFEVGKCIYFQEDVFCYEGIINLSYPDIMIEITSSEKMQQIDRMEYPIQMGFDNQYSQYSKIMVYDYKSSSDVVCKLYILNDNEIIIEGDVHRYYRAVRKNGGKEKSLI
jgi:hypothetical protein